MIRSESPFSSLFFPVYSVIRNDSRNSGRTSLFFTGCGNENCRSPLHDWIKWDMERTCKRGLKSLRNSRSIFRVRSYFSSSSRVLVVLSSLQISEGAEIGKLCSAFSENENEIRKTFLLFVSPHAFQCLNFFLSTF